MAELQWTEVDGVSTVWADIPGPLRAGLLFRTGHADETMATIGKTHLIEHLALSMLSESVQRHNGFVSGVVTGFFIMDQPQEVSVFFAKVCEALSSLPGDRLESEKNVLAAENATHSYDFRSNLLTWRYGASGYGLLDMPDYGCRNATLEELQEYALQRFTNTNAILWLSGPPPSDLRLKLPAGIKHPIPPLQPVLPTFPCWFTDDACRGVAAGAIVPRASSSTIFGDIAARRLRDRLRTEQAVSYAPSAYYDPLNAEVAHLVLFADSDPDHRVELARAFGEVFEKLGEFNDAEVEASRREIHEHWTGALAPPPADLMMTDIQRATMDWLFGREFESLEIIDRDLLAVSTDDVSKFGREFQANALFALPTKAELRPSFGARAPYSILPVVKGREIAHLDAPINREKLLHGTDGVSVIMSNGIECTVRYNNLAAALHFEDGCMELIGFDSARVIIEPTLWRDGHKVCREIRERVPAHLLLDQGSRPADSIPMPETTAWQRFRSRFTKN